MACIACDRKAPCCQLQFCHLLRASDYDASDLAVDLLTQARAWCSFDARWQSVPAPVTACGPFWERSEDAGCVGSAQAPFRFTYAQPARPKHSLTSLSMSLSDVKLTRLECDGQASSARLPPDPATLARDAAVASPRSHHSGNSTTARAGDRYACKAHDMGTIRTVSIFQAPVPPSSADEKARPVMVMMDCVHLIMSEAARYVPRRACWAFSSTIAGAARSSPSQSSCSIHVAHDHCALLRIAKHVVQTGVVQHNRAPEGAVLCPAAAASTG
jgi:hypothetical protein